MKNILEKDPPKHFKQIVNSEMIQWSILSFRQPQKIVKENWWKFILYKVTKTKMQKEREKSYYIFWLDARWRSGWFMSIYIINIYLWI